ncbi:unnamed protein product [Ixodes hexagonus]
MIVLVKICQKFSDNLLQLSAAPSYALPWRDWQNNEVTIKQSVHIESQYKHLIKNVILLFSRDNNELETVATGIIDLEKEMAKLDEMRRDRVSVFWTTPTLSTSALSNSFKNRVRIITFFT